MMIEAVTIEEEVGRKKLQQSRSEFLLPFCHPKYLSHCTHIYIYKY